MYLCSSLGENPYLVCTSRSLVEMEKTPERLLMNIPEEPFTGSCKRSQKNILHVHFLFTLWKYIITCTSHTQTHTHKYFFLFLNNGKQTTVFMIGQLFLSSCQRMFVSIFVPLQTHVVSFPILGLCMLVHMFISFSSLGLLCKLEFSPMTEPCDTKLARPKWSISLELKEFPCHHPFTEGSPLLQPVGCGGDLFSHIVFQFCSASIFSRSAATESSPDDSVENPLFIYLASACPVYLFWSFILGCET